MKLCAFADEVSSQIQRQIDAMQRNGIELLEIRGIERQNIKDITVEKAEEVRRRFEDAGLGIWSMGSPIGKVSVDGNFEAHLDDHKRIMELADVLGTKRIRMFSFYNSQENPVSAEEFEERAFEMMRRLCDATPADFLLCHENEKDIFGETPENCLKLVREFPRLRMIFDPANYVQCGVDTLAAWEMTKEYVDYMHIKDAGADGKVVPAGMGIGNVGTIVKDFLARGGEVLSVEPHLRAFVGLDQLENGQSLSTKISYRDSDEAFDAACKALKALLP